ncbi:MFS transporter [Micromonospora sp. NPDC047753]|uniref:MFS transporter n=1 Tax=Micromonospora sp. NPDC047753 TaxID=3154817 RepID=UPI0033CF9275
MVTAAAGPADRPVSAWAPLRTAVYRNLWLALLAANIGTWMQTVGAQWLLINHSNASTLVALVQTASLLPVLLLALPAGVLADSFDRRHLLIAVQLFLVAVAVVLTLLTVTDRMPPALLLTLTFAFGVGQALTLPAWAAVIPELVPQDQLRSASALGSISVNVARAVGPAVAGVLIARTGVAPVFGINAVAFAIFAYALWRWRPGNARAVEVPERFTAALRAGSRYVRHSPIVRRLLRRALVFVVPASALWALLPLVASRRLGLGSGGYGVLLAALGVGAIAGGVLLAVIRTRLTANQLLLIAGALFTVALTVVGTVRAVPLVLLALLPAGMAWVTVLANVNAEMQLFLPSWVRARGLAVYQVCFAGGQAAGALLWGLVAEMAGLLPAYLAAAALMLLGTLTSRIWPLPDLRSVNREPAADQHADAVEPGGVQLVEVVAVPAPGVVQHVPSLEPLRPQHAGHLGVGEPLRPGHGVVGDAGQRHPALALQDHAGAHRVQRGAQLPGALLEGVQEDPVDAELAGQRRDLLGVTAHLAPGAGVPRVVVDKDPHPTLLERAHHIG